MVVVINIAVLAVLDHDPDLARRINGFDQRDVSPGPQGISVGIMRHVIIVGLPGCAVNLVANLPILEAQRRRPLDPQKVFAVVRSQRRGGAQGGPIPRCLPVGAVLIGAQRQRVGRRGIAIRHPRRRFIGRARAVVQRDHGLPVDVGDHLNVTGRARCPRPTVLVLPVLHPVVIVGIGPARETQRLDAHVGQQRNRLWCVKIVVPDGPVQSEPAGVRRPDGLAGIDRYRRKRRRRISGQLDVIQIKHRLRRAGGVLDDKTGEVCHARYPQS